jgi:hypothetical protein
MGNPDQDLEMYPRALRHEYGRAFRHLMSRVIQHSSSPGSRLMDPCYVGTDDQSVALELDSSGTIGNNVVGVATLGSHWVTLASEVKFTPPPTASSALSLFSAWDRVAFGAICQSSIVLSCKRLHIVGGRDSPQVLVRIIAVTGLDYEDIDWLEAEKSKPPSDLKRRWAHLDAQRDITVCITGRIGHAQSLAAATAAGKRGAIHIEVESANGLADALVLSALSSLI